MVQGFLLGVIATASVIAGLFFLRFWREARDSFFLAFACAFLIEGMNRTAFIFLEHPNEGNPWIYIVRLVAFLLILGAILKKNYGRNG
jgi:uncharacterized membrane protein HdeD (DUF308 family)